MVTLSVRGLRRFLIGLNAALALGVAACLCCAVFLRPQVNTTGQRRPRQAQTSPARRVARLGPADSYTVIYQRGFREPLFDPKPIAPVESPATRPKLALELVGTVVEPGFTYGVFRTASGQEKLVCLGQDVEGAELAAVRAESATLKFHGDLITLEVRKKEDGK